MRKKISIIGAGNVGSATALWVARNELGDVVLYNRTRGLAEGKALDLKESSPVEGFDLSITGTDQIEQTRDSDVVVLTAGMARQPGMSRDDLLTMNASLISAIGAKIAQTSPNAVLIVVSNPVDAMVHVAAEATSFPRQRVMGMAGILDSARFRTFIALELGVSVEDTNALVLGGHGDFMVPLPRYASVGGIPVVDLLPESRIAADAALRLLQGGFYDSVEQDPLTTRDGPDALRAQIGLAEMLLRATAPTVEREEVEFIAAILYTRAAKTLSDRVAAKAYASKARAAVDAFEARYPESLRAAIMPVLREALARL